MIHNNLNHNKLIGDNMTKLSETIEQKALQLGYFCDAEYPTQNHLQTWLRNEHKINICIHGGEFDDDFDYFGTINVLHKDCLNKLYPRGKIEVPRFHKVNSYEDCLDHCLIMALGILLDGRSVFNQKCGKCNELIVFTKHNIRECRGNPRDCGMGGYNYYVRCSSCNKEVSTNEH